MKAFFEDLWQDLLAKRLWPVAAAMALAIVAVPAVLTVSASEPPPPPVAVTADTAANAPDRPVLALDGEGPSASGKGSALDVFSPDDPFTPPKSVSDGRSSTATTATAKPPGGGDGKGAQGPTGGGSPPDAGARPGPPPVAPAPPRTTEYEYVADVTFWHNDRRRRMHGLRKLDMLPNDSAPVLIFMGASSEGGNAVFLVDSTLQATGEGTCEPSGSNCAFVHVGPGSEHLFTSEEGDTYRLRIDEIRRVEARGGAASADAARPSAHTAKGSARPSARRFSLPSLVDVVAVTSGGEADRSSISQETR